MKAVELKEKFLTFFETKGHKRIPSASLIPENDPSVLFTTAGMHPLVPYLMGQPHALGKRLCDVQKCIRTGDIDDVGDTTHHTFFEMLGNWSLGDYFKQEAIEWSYEFLTGKDWLNIDLTRLAFTCFAGDDDAPRDEQAAQFWKDCGVPKERIAFLPKKENWWPAEGVKGPCGPDTEMFYWSDNSREPPEIFDPEDDTWVEIWNDVFMQYNKKEDGTYEPLTQQNVDTGLGVERVAAVLQGLDDNYRTERFWPIIQEVEKLSGHTYEDKTREMRIIADHVRSAVFVLGDPRGITPSNVDQGYILRRFIRRAIRIFHTLGVDKNVCEHFAQKVVDMYKSEYPELEENQNFILQEMKKEEEKFRQTLQKGIKEFDRVADKMLEHGATTISGKTAFLLFQSYGFPLEMTLELAEEKKMDVDQKGFNKAFEKHQEASRKGAEQKFKGGLADDSEQTTKLHTATHLLNEALRKVIDPNITQKGSNITAQRLRFDFNFDRKLTPEEIKKVEEEVNKVIQEGIHITVDEMSPDQAKAQGAQAEFGTRYPDKVTVYTIGDYSKEICMGPHVNNTKDIGKFRITKEQSSSAGVRRIKAVVE